jgi:5-methylcytosine-specific restriction protein A
MPQIIPHFTTGQTYNRKLQITGAYGDSGQSGIAPSNQSPAISLFTGLSGEQYGYTDTFDDSTFLLRYTGEGQLGPMTMTRGNLAITTHAATGRALHVFETLGKGEPCLYKGEFVYISHDVERGPDKAGHKRDIIVFQLMPVWHTLRIEQENEQEEAPVLQKKVPTPSLAVLRQAAVAACRPAEQSPQTKEAIRSAYQRSVKVKQYVLASAAGICELCGCPAPFLRKKDSSPYLEPHHINRLSDGGLDHPQFVGAICPAYHREIHSGEYGQVKNEELRERVQVKEAQMDKVHA